MPYRIIKSLDPNMRKQVSNGLNMATVQTTIGTNDSLTVPEDCQTSVFWEMTIDGDLTIDGELIIQ